MKQVKYQDGFGETALPSLDRWLAEQRTDEPGASGPDVAGYNTGLIDVPAAAM
ncbi:MAG: hypothetical protein WCH43_03270 [Verrucomicrobiota bacterium]